MMEQEKLVDIANSLSNEDLCHLISMLADRFDVYYGCHNKVMLSSGVEFACPNGATVQINCKTADLEDLKEDTAFLYALNETDQNSVATEH